MSQLTIEFSKVMRPYLDNTFLLAVSGGKDSIALMHLYLHMREHFKVQFAVAHIHHGASAGAQGKYRDKAQEFVRGLCKLHQIPFFTNRAEAVQTAGSENEWRQLRYAQLESLAEQGNFDWIVLAHHGQDQMETRLMRLIRGTGRQGFSGMKLTDRNRFRPLLSFQPEQLREYLQELNAQWLDDPSNELSDKFRNWLRNDWLPQLESYRPGSLASLTRSLEILTEGQEPPLPSCIMGHELLLNEFYPLSLGDKQRVIAAFLNSLGMKNYGMAHVNEIIKRLDSDQKSLKFQLLRHQWVVDAGRLKVLGPGSIEPPPRR